MEASFTSQLISYAETVREVNDVLQGRSDVSINMLFSTLRRIEKENPDYAPAVSNIKKEIEAFQFQKMLRSKPYTRTGSQTYQYKLWEYDPEHPLKIIDQGLFDHAAEYGFPPDFFRESYFDHVTVYCIPDGADCSGSHFQNCSFTVCGIRGAVFDNADLYDTNFQSSLIQMVNFTGASIAHSHFRDCTMMSVSFQDARLKSCLTLDCTMDRVDFLGAVLNGASYGRITASGIQNLYNATITQGGATTKEVRNLRASIFRELNVLMFPAKHRPPADRRRKVSAPER